MNTTRVLALGGGLVRDGRGGVGLSPASVHRAARTVRYYFDNARRFAADADAWIVCSGGYPGLSQGWPVPDAEMREALLMRAELVRAGVPAALIRTEADSWSTVTNLVNCVDRGLLTPAEFGPGRPLGIVTHPFHMRRVARLAALCGIAAVQPIPTAQRDGYVRETVIRALTTLGVRDLESAQRRERLLAAIRAPRGTTSR